MKVKQTAKLRIGELNHNVNTIESLIFNRRINYHVT